MKAASAEAAFTTKQKDYLKRALEKRELDSEEGRVKVAEFFSKPGKVFEPDVIHTWYDAEEKFTHGFCGKWINVGPTKPSKGRELKNVGLAKALIANTEFTKQRFDDLDVLDLRMDDFIMSGDSYFKPAEYITDDDVVERSSPPPPPLHTHAHACMKRTRTCYRNKMNPIRDQVNEYLNSKPYSFQLLE
jgi:hypothetical protein